MTNQTPPPDQNMNWATPPNQPLRFPHRREIKFVAKRIMMHPVCMRVTLLLVCISVAFYGIRYLAGGTLTYGVMNLADYSGTQSGIFFNEQGFSILFRMDLTQTVLAIPLTYRQIAVFVIINVLCLALLAPLRLGAMEQYWNVMRTGQGNVFGVGQWYRQSGRMGKAIVVEFVITVLVRIIGVVATIPSLYLYYLFYTSTPSLDAYTSASSMLQMGAGILAIAAVLFTFWLHTILLPVRYCLCAHPEYSIGQAFRRGMASTKGFRGGFFGFRLSYILWFAASQFTYGVLDLYVLPYTSLGGMIFISEAARLKQGQKSQEPEQAE